MEISDRGRGARERCDPGGAPAKIVQDPSPGAGEPSRSFHQEPDDIPEPPAPHTARGAALAILLNLALDTRVWAQSSGETSAGDYEPGTGFVVARGDEGELAITLWTYARHLNQKSLDDSCADAFGRTFPIDRRHDIAGSQVLGEYSDPWDLGYDSVPFARGANGMTYSGDAEFAF